MNFGVTFIRILKWKNVFFWKLQNFYINELKCTIKNNLYFKFYEMETAKKIYNNKY